MAMPGCECRTDWRSEVRRPPPRQPAVDPYIRAGGPLDTALEVARYWRSAGIDYSHPTGFLPLGVGVHAAARRRRDLVHAHDTARHFYRPGGAVASSQRPH